MANISLASIYSNVTSVDVGSSPALGKMLNALSGLSSYDPLNSYKKAGEIRPLT